MTIASLVLEHPPAPPAELAGYLRSKLAYYTDAADLAHDLRERLPGIAVIDARAAAAYRDGHIPGALSFPHRTMDAASTAGLDRALTYVVYCDGIGCNASTKGAYKLAALGFSVKELIGGLVFWKRDDYPVALGETAGSLVEPGGACGC